jgi:DNA polymerase III subunit gamma/tau
VLSRCLQFNLKQMPPGHIVGHLENILGQEGVTYDQPALRLLAQGAHGSMRDALSLTDQAIAYAAGQVTLDAVQGMLGALDQSYLVRLLDALANQDGADLMAVADEMASRSLSYNGALQDLATLLHRIALAQSVPTAVPEDLPELPDILRLAGAFDAQELQLYYQIAVHGRNEIGLAPDEYAGFTMTLLRMLAFRPGQGGAEGVAPAGGHAAPARPAQQARPAAAAVASHATVPTRPPVASQAEPAAPAPATAAPAAVAPGPAAPAAPQPASARPDAPMSPARAAINAALEAARAASRNVGGGAKRPSGPPPGAAGASAAAAPVAPAPAAPPGPQMSAAPQPAAGPPAPQMRAAAAPQSPPSPQAPQMRAAAPQPPAPPPWEQGQPAMRSAAPQAAAPQAAAEYDDADTMTEEPPSWATDFSDDNSVAAEAAPLAPPPAPTRAPAAAPYAYTITPVDAIGWDGNWPALAASLPLRGVSQQLALQTELIECVADAASATFRLRVPVDTLRASGNSEKLCAALQERFPHIRVNVDTQIAPVWYTAGAEQKADRERRQREAEAMVEADPFVQAMARQFDAFVVPGSVKPNAA